MMTTDEKRRLWLEEFTREFAFARTEDASGDHNNDDYARFAESHANEVLAHASRLMPDFAEPEREFDRAEAAYRMAGQIFPGPVPSSWQVEACLKIIDGKIPGVKYTPPTTTNPG